MKVVLFCGGLGLRIRETELPPDLSLRRASDVPKPLQLIGGQPLLQHVMSWYARWGVTHFILCLGVGSELIHEWVRETASEIVDEHVPRAGVRSVRIVGGAMDGWRIDLAETGISSSVGQRLAQVRDLVDDEPLFLANYADGLSDVPLDALIENAKKTEAVATFVAVPPATSLHSVSFDPASGLVDRVQPLADAGVWINGGYFVLRPSIFDDILPGEELVNEPFDRLAARGELVAFAYAGFWRACDTVKDRQDLQQIWDSNRAPWALSPGPAGGIDVPLPARRTASLPVARPV